MDQATLSGWQKLEINCIHDAQDIISIGFHWLRSEPMLTCHQCCRIMSGGILVTIMNYLVTKLFMISLPNH